MAFSPASPHEQATTVQIRFGAIKTAMAGLQRMEQHIGREAPHVHAYRSQLKLIDMYRDRIDQARDDLEQNGGMTYNDMSELSTIVLDCDVLHAELTATINAAIDSFESEQAEARQALQPPRVAIHDEWSRNGQRFNVEHFGGDFTKWPKFKEMFVTFVHDHPLKTAQEKFMHLDAHLVKDSEAAQTISGYPRTGDNYEPAWNQLCRAYDNKRKLVGDIVDRFLDMKSVAKPSREALVAVINNTNHVLGSLPKYEIDVSSWDAIVVPIITRKLDQSTTRQWQFERPQRDLAKIGELLEFLQRRADSLTMANNEQRSGQANTATVAQRTTPQRSEQPNRQRKPPSCPCCNQEHQLFNCIEFRALSIAEKKKRVRTYNVCYNCLKRGCEATKCSLRACIRCQVKHNSLLCEAPPNSAAGGSGQSAAVNAAGNFAN